MMQGHPRCDTPSKSPLPLQIGLGVCWGTLRADEHLDPWAVSKVPSEAVCILAFQLVVNLLYTTGSDEQCQ